MSSYLWIFNFSLMVLLVMFIPLMWKTMKSVSSVTYKILNTEYKILFQCKIFRMQHNILIDEID